MNDLPRSDHFYSVNGEPFPVGATSTILHSNGLFTYISPENMKSIQITTISMLRKLQIKKRLYLQCGTLSVTKIYFMV